MNFTNVDVVKTTEDRFSLSWEAIPMLPEVLTDYSISMFWSHAPSAGFNEVLDEFGNDVVLAGTATSYVHYLKDRQHAKRRYYKIVIWLTADPTDKTSSKVVFVNDIKDGVLDTVEHAEKILYEEYTGDPFYLLKRDTSGARCPECWDPIRFARKKTTCNTCNGTGYFKGFYEKIEVQVSIDATPTIMKVGLTGEVNVTTIKGRMSSIPSVFTGDVLISRDTAIRYSIIQVDKTKLPNLSTDANDVSSNDYNVSQILTLSEIEPDDTRYQASSDTKNYDDGLSSEVSVLSGAGVKS